MMHLKRACADFIIGYFSTHDRSKKTTAAYGSDLTQFQEFAGKDFDLLSLSGSIIEQWAAHLRHKGYAPASIRRKIVVLKVFCSYWVRKGTLLESPFWRVKLSFGRVVQLPRTLTESEMQALFIQAGRHYSTVRLNHENLERIQSGQISWRYYRVIRNFALVDLLFATGMRVGEASALDLEDFLIEEAVFKLQGKGGR